MLKGMLNRIGAFHRKEPLKEGITKEELKGELPRTASTKLFNRILEDLDNEGSIVRAKELVRLSSHKVILDDQERGLQGRLLEILNKSDLQPPTVKDLSGQINENPQQVRNLLHVLIKEGSVVKVTDDLYFSRKAIDRLRDGLIDFLRANGSITTQQFKDLSGVTRKFAIPLAEYFDSMKITIRVGEKRLPRDKALDE